MGEPASWLFPGTGGCWLLWHPWLVKSSCPVSTFTFTTCMAVFMFPTSSTKNGSCTERRAYPSSAWPDPLAMTLFPNKVTFGGTVV
jgi:hypothetical protein